MLFSIHKKELELKSLESDKNVLKGYMENLQEKIKKLESDLLRVSIELETEKNTIKVHENKEKELKVSRASIKKDEGNSGDEKKEELGTNLEVKDQNLAGSMVVSTVKKTEIELTSKEEKINTPIQRKNPFGLQRDRTSLHGSTKSNNTWQTRKEQIFAEKPTSKMKDNLETGRKEEQSSPSPINNRQQKEKACLNSSRSESNIENEIKSRSSNENDIIVGSDKVLPKKAFEKPKFKPNHHHHNHNIQSENVLPRDNTFNSLSKHGINEMHQDMSLLEINLMIKGSKI